MMLPVAKHCCKNIMMIPLLATWVFLGCYLLLLRVFGGLGCVRTANSTVRSVWSARLRRYPPSRLLASCNLSPRLPILLRSALWIRSRTYHSLLLVMMPFAPLLTACPSMRTLCPVTVQLLLRMWLSYSSPLSLHAMGCHVVLYLIEIHALCPSSGVPLLLLLVVTRG